MDGENADCEECFYTTRYIKFIFHLIFKDILLINHILKRIQIGTLKRTLLFIRKVIQYSLNWHIFYYKLLQDFSSKKAIYTANFILKSTTNFKIKQSDSKNIT